jgi:hypothetical protein
MTVPYFPASLPKVAVQAVQDAFAGKKVPRFIPGLPYGTVTKPFAVTKQSLGSYKPEY